MKRMNVREFRKNISHLDNEPIEVVRYSETIGFWTPIALTTEPKTKLTRKWSAVKARKMSEDDFTERLRAIMAGVAMMTDGK